MDRLVAAILLLTLCGLIAGPANATYQMHVGQQTVPLDGQTTYWTTEGGGGQQTIDLGGSGGQQITVPSGGQVTYLTSTGSGQGVGQVPFHTIHISGAQQVQPTQVTHWTTSGGYGLGGGVPTTISLTGGGVGVYPHGGGGQAAISVTGGGGGGGGHPGYPRRGRGRGRGRGSSSSGSGSRRKRRVRRSGSSSGSSSGGRRRHRTRVSHRGGGRAPATTSHRVSLIGGGTGRVGGGLGIGITGYGGGHGGIGLVGGGYPSGVLHLGVGGQGVGYVPPPTIHITSAQPAVQPAQVTHWTTTTTTSGVPGGADLGIVPYGGGTLHGGIVPSVSYSPVGSTAGTSHYTYTWEDKGK